MPGIIDLKRRIKSVQSTRKITKAMQMVSAAKMRKAQNAVVASRTYSSLAWDLISNLTQKISIEHPLLKTYPKATKVGVILLGTNTGLVGGLNTNLQNRLRELGTAPEVLSEVVVYGKKAKVLAQRMRQPIVADFQKEEKTLTSEDIYPLAQYITKAYTSGEYKKIVIVYNQFVSTLVQRPSMKQLLPFTDNRELSTDSSAQLSVPSSQKTDYLYEPKAEEVLAHLIPRIIESQIYQAILESNASEHSARMVMMKNATEAAGDLIADYTLTYNRLRQDKITTELAEITAGRIALE